MRIRLATMSHETNTFSPVPTKLDRFCREGTTLLSGRTATDFYRGTGTRMGGSWPLRMKSAPKSSFRSAPAPRPAARWTMKPTKRSAT
ncbi:MAG: Metallopeptidase family [Acetobacteraceae bacterium]|nr:Metallopeptidase family [Acetobacteraceae bacterium]